MLIRAKQMQEFSLSMENQANRDLVDYAQERFPDEFQEDDPQVLEFVKTVRTTAKQYNIEKENDVASFLDFSVMYGLDFPKSSWAEDILISDSLYGPDKIAILKHRIAETGVKL